MLAEAPVRVDQPVAGSHETPGTASGSVSSSPVDGCASGAPTAVSAPRAARMVYFGPGRLTTISLRNKTLSRFLLFAGVLLACAAALAQLPVEVHPNQLSLLASPDAQVAANKQLAFDFWREVVQAHHVEHAAEFLAQSFRQHDPTIPTGRAEFLRRIEAVPATGVKPTIDDLVAIVAENDLVVLSFRRELPDLGNEGQTYTTTWFEMLRIENGKITEHWDYGTKE